MPTNNLVMKTAINPAIPRGLCQCGCGEKTTVNTRNKTATGEVKGEPRWFIAGHSSRRHGHSFSGVYKSWLSMMSRCYYKRDVEYKNYGGRGITVSERWRTFTNFLQDMGERPEGMTLDRIDSNGSYELANCRWATWMEQAHNRRTNRCFIYNGVPYTLGQLARFVGIDNETLWRRLHLGWSVEKAVTVPVRAWSRKT